jgi:pyoverdine/dityrosine biosynthesis protein Dit1
VIYKRIEKLYNPLIQNDVHIKRLEEVLDNINDIKFISIVAFTLRADIKVKTDKNLIYSLKLPKTIRKYKEEVMDEHKVNQIYEAIKVLNIKDKEIKKEHISKIKNYKKEDKKICPKCQSELILRSGKYGNFWGCSDYPNCKYTKQISK